MDLKICARLLILCLGLLIVGCSATPDKIDSKAPSRKKKTTTIKSQQDAKKAQRRKTTIEHNKKALPDALFRGVWIVEGSDAEFKIDFKDGAVLLEGYDYQDNEKFTIINTRWNKKTVNTAVIIPSTNRKLNLKLDVLNANTLKCKFSGDAAGEAIWQRKP